MKNFASWVSSAAVLLASYGVARAGHAAEDAQHEAQESIVPKVDLACGSHLTVEYDAESLKKNNKDIGYDQTGGSNECNEPLRMLWYACKTDQGKAAVKAAKIGKVVCRGTAGKVGSLKIANGTITVERSVEEQNAPEPPERSAQAKPGVPEKPYIRSHRQFEEAMKLSIALAQEDPYSDQDWNALRQQPNPVVSTTDYCMVNGKKVALDDNHNEYDTWKRRKEDATVKCWRGGKVITDVQIKKGRLDGLITERLVDGSSTSTYRDDKLEGEQRVYENGALKWTSFFQAGEQLWHRDLYPSGKLRSYWRKAKDGRADINIAENGNVQGMRCTPDIKDDKDLRKWCGFDGAMTVPIYDGTGKVARVQTWKNGVLSKEGGGTSDYANGTDVAYKGGKKHGEERIVDKTGKLVASVMWDHGVQDGREREFADDGKKVVKEIVWKAGEVKEHTEFYLNGSPKLRETFETKQRKEVKRYFDSGKISDEGAFLQCRTRWENNAWCEDGLHKTFYETGVNASEMQFDKGQREGTSKSWWPDGKPSAVESYAKDKITKAKRWDKDGKLLVDEEYEADGSRKRK